MDSYNFLLSKLESFIRRYYVNELIKGGILFFSIGLLYFILTMLVEYFLWLNSLGRSVLFWGFVLVEVLLLVKFLVIPLLKLVKLSKGLDHQMASRIIGNHFPEVKDKLLNVLQLKSDQHQSELLLASIEQKSSDLKPVPFSSAVDFRINLKYLKYAVIPVAVILVIVFSGNTNLFADSYTRVVNYSTAYEPPAPFEFQIVTPSLRILENEDFTLEVRTLGEMVPENATVNYDGQTYFLSSIGPGSFEFTFEKVTAPTSFILSANGVVSRPYKIEIIKVPRLLDFQMLLDFPNYTGKLNEVYDGSGNATVPEGTRVKWVLETVSTEKVSLISKDTTEIFGKEDKSFVLQKQLMEDFGYEITTSNREVASYERLKYVVEVIPDQFPRLELEAKKDSVDKSTWYFYGNISDDYGLDKVLLRYHQEGQPQKLQSVQVPITGGMVDEFISAFPGELDLEKGSNYEFYFEVFDNDGLRNGKSVKSQVFDYRKRTDEEVQEQLLEQQNEAIQGLNESLEEMEFTEEELKELTRTRKEQGSLNYSDRNKLESFLKRQRRQLSMMKNYSEKLKKSLSESNELEDNEMKKQLQERLERREDQLQENEDILKELEEYSNKIEQEELSKKLEDLSKRNQNQERNLEQLLELTKRYYVTEKSAKLSRNLEALAEEQEKLSEMGEENTKEKQDSLNSDFDGLQEEMEDLQKENQDLKEPMDLGMEESLQKEVEKEQERASDELQKGEKKAAEKSQKKASEAMKQMAGKMRQQQQMGSGQQLEADAKMLRQILDNLLVFSFEQEGLLEDFRNMDRNSPQYAGKLRSQNVLKVHFQHVDDSLYALALRNPMISEKITEKLTNIEYDLDKALERLADNELPQGIGSQQYVMTGANDLTYLLSEIMNQMQQMMQNSASGRGEGKGQGKGEMQLPDLIQKQRELGEKMKKGMDQKKGQGSSGSEELNGELFEIFKEQQSLRKALEDQMRKEGIDRAGEGLKEEMEQLEEEMLEKGFSQEVLDRMQNLEHRLLELEDARLREGQKEERESNANDREYEDKAVDQLIEAKEYFNRTEILNRQSLPLRQIYQRKVKEYFERGDD